MCPRVRLGCCLCAHLPSSSASCLSSMLDVMNPSIAISPHYTSHLVTPPHNRPSCSLLVLEGEVRRSAQLAAQEVRCLILPIAEGTRTSRSISTPILPLLIHSSLHHSHHSLSIDRSHIPLAHCPLASCLFIWYSDVQDQVLLNSDLASVADRPCSCLPFLRRQRIGVG